MPYLDVRNIVPKRGMAMRNNQSNKFLTQRNIASREKRSETWWLPCDEHLPKASKQTSFSKYANMERTIQTGNGYATTHQRVMR